MTNHTLITLAWELHEQGVPKTHIAHKLGKHRETIILWMQGVERYGLMGFLERYEQAKKGPRLRRQVDPILKRWVWAIREREMDCCGEKIAYYLKKERGISLAPSKVYEILHEKYILRTKWRKNTVRGPIPHATKPREVIQMDSVDFGGVFAFTGIDIYSREADVFLAPALTASFGDQFLIQSMRRRFDGHVHLLQTDGGPEFKDEFKAHVSRYCDRHRVARPYRKNEQSYVESFNRSLRKECLGWRTYPANHLAACTELVESFLERYHYHRPHMGLGMRPPLTKD